MFNSLIFYHHGFLSEVLEIGINEILNFAWTINANNTDNTVPWIKLKPDCFPSLPTDPFDDEKIAVPA